MERIDALKARRGKLADYPCVRRLRNRWLIVSLYLQGFQPAHDWMLHETDLFMSGRHLQQLVACGMWSQALDYIRRFLSPSLGGVEARTLCFFLHTFWAVDKAAACSMGAPVTTAVYNHDVLILKTMCARNAKLSSTLNKIHHSPNFRASLDWKLVREKAALIAHDLALDSPELRRRLLLPRELPPIGPCHRRHQLKKQALRPASSAIAKWFLNRKKSLPSSTPVIGLNSEGQNRVVNLIEECLKAGTVVELHQGHLLQSSAMADAFSTPSSQTILDTTDSTKSIVTSSVTSSGAPTFSGLPNYLRWNPSVANSGDSVSQPAKIRIPWIISSTNAGPVNLKERLTNTEEDDPNQKRQRSKLELATETEAGPCAIA